MPWALAAAAVPAVGALTNNFGAGSGGGGARGVNLTSAQSDPWNLAARQGSLDAQAQQQQFLNQLQAQNGVGNQSQVFNQQQQLAQQLQQNALGQGPNPAQAMLANQTGQNVSQQAALMGSQRGASQNVGLMQRQAAQQGAGIQQNAVGQAAALQAQQQLAAQQQLQQQQASMAGLATQQVGQAQSGIQNQTQVAQNQQQMQLQSLGNWNNANVSAANGSQAAGLGYAQLGQQQNAALASGLGAGLSLFGAGGNSGASPTTGGSGQGYLGQTNFTGGGTSGFNPNAYAHGGQVSPQSCYGQKLKGMNMKSGGPVPGKAQVKGDSPKNDTVPAVLSPGEIVIPRSELSGPNAGDNAKRFVEAVMAKQRRR